MCVVLHFAFPEEYLFFQRQFNYLNTFISTTAFHLFSATFALNEKKMTVVVGAVYVAVAGFIALMTDADDFLGDSLSQPLVKHKILSDKCRFQTLCVHLPCIIDDSSVQLVHIFKPIMA